VTISQINRRLLTSLVLGASLISKLGCSKESESKIANIRVIDYGHMRDGVLYHGTVSDLDGAPKSTWTYEQSGRKVIRDRPINQQSFKMLCDGIKDYSVFQKNLVKDSKARIDPSTFHVVSVISDDHGRQLTQIFLIPGGETDSEFTQWLKTLNVP
jgi:hypothetical protein